MLGQSLLHFTLMQPVKIVRNAGGLPRAQFAHAVMSVQVVMHC